MLPRVGIFVTEWSADVIIPLFRQVGFPVTAIWSRTPQIAKKIASNFSIPYFTSTLDELLLRKDVDVVFINCPPFLHAEIAVKALGIGKHVVCQLPAGLTTEDTEKMINAARYYPSLLSLIQHEARFLPAYIKMKELITSGYCGKLLLCDIRIHTGSLVANHYNWLCNSKMGGGSLNLIGSSVIDLVSFLTESKATKVLGHFHTFLEHQGNIQGFRSITSDDFCTFQMLLDSGLRVHVTINTMLHGSCYQELIVIGEKCRLIIRNDDLYGSKSDSGKEETIYTSQQYQNGNTDCALSHDRRGFHVTAGFEFVKALKSAFETCKDDINGLVNYSCITRAATFEEGHYVRAVIDAIRESNTTREWNCVKFNVPQNGYELNP